MKTRKVYILSVLICFFSVFFCGCISAKNYDYKNEYGYKEYISDSNKGLDDITYFNVKDSLHSEEGKKYYEKNSRRSGDYLITDYEDGVCINRCYKQAVVLSEDYPYMGIKIPERIDGKPVVKLGGFLSEDEILGAFVGTIGLTLEIPSTVKVITSDAVKIRTDMYPENYRSKVAVDFYFEVDSDNPYYSSKNGSIFSKDKKKLLWLYRSGNTYTVPVTVESFEPTNGIFMLNEWITIGKNVKSINTFIDFGEDGYGPIDGLKPEVVIKGYKNTAAEKWAKEQNARFITLKD